MKDLFETLEELSQDLNFSEFNDVEGAGEKYVDIDLDNEDFLRSIESLGDLEELDFT